MQGDGETAVVPVEALRSFVVNQIDAADYVTKAGVSRAIQWENCLALVDALAAPATQPSRTEEASQITGWQKVQGFDMPVATYASPPPAVSAEDVALAFAVVHPDGFGQYDDVISSALDAAKANVLALLRPQDNQGVGG